MSHGLRQERSMNVEKGEAPAPGILPQITIVGCFSIECILAVPTLSLRDRIIGTYFDSRPGGAGFHQAVACARLSRISLEKPEMMAHFTAVNVIGAVGDDYHGVQIAKALADEMVEFSDLVVMRDTPTNMLFAIKDQKDRQATVAIPNVSMELTEKGEDSGGSDFMKKLRREIPGPWPDVLILQPELMDSGFIHHMVRLANRKFVPIVMEPTTPHNFSWNMLKNVDHLVMSELEAQTLLDYPSPEGNPSLETMAKVRDKLRRKGAKSVVITLRSRGTILYSKRTLREHVTRESLRREGFNWMSFRHAFTAAYAVAVARNKKFSIRAAVHDALEIAELAAERGTPDLPGLGELQPSFMRFDHESARRKDRALKSDRHVTETLRKYTGGGGAGLERSRAVGAGSRGAPADGGQGDSEGGKGLGKGDGGDEGYGVYGVYGEYQNGVWKRKQGHTLGGEDMPPSKRLHLRLGNEGTKAEGPREGNPPGTSLGRDGGTAVGDGRESWGKVGEDGSREDDRDGAEDGDGAGDSDETEDMDVDDDDDGGDDSESDEGC